MTGHLTGQPDIATSCIRLFTGQHETQSSDCVVVMISNRIWFHQPLHLFTQVMDGVYINGLSQVSCDYKALYNQVLGGNLPAQIDVSCQVFISFTL